VTAQVEPEILSSQFAALGSAAEQIQQGVQHMPFLQRDLVLVKIINFLALLYFVDDHIIRHQPVQDLPYTTVRKQYNIVLTNPHTFAIQD
jgi:hypothetical protein